MTPLDGYYGGFVWAPGVNVCIAPESAGTPAGFYASTKLSEATEGSPAARSWGHATGAYGRVETWGWTADNGANWGSERARILEVFVAARHAGHIAALAAHYGVPVSQG